MQAKTFAFYSVDNQSHETLLHVHGFMKSHQYCIRRIRKKDWRLLPKEKDTPKAYRGSTNCLGYDGGENKSRDKRCRYKQSPGPMKRKDWLDLGEGLALGRRQEWAGVWIIRMKARFQEQGKSTVFTSAYDFLK